VDVVHSGPGRQARSTLAAEQIVFAAGVLETQRLLHRMKLDGHLAHVSDRLGELTRTNAESLGGATAKDYRVDYSHGVCQGTSFFPDEQTHVEIVRNGKGSNTTSLLMTVMTPGNSEGGPQRSRWRRFLLEAGRHPGTLARSLWVRRWSERGLITLTMQDRDCSLTVTARKNRFGGVYLRTQPGPEPAPTWIPVAQEATALLADEMGGEPSAPTRTSWRSRSPPMCSGDASSERMRTPVSSTRTTASTATPDCTSSTDRPSRPIWVSTPPSRSPHRPSGPWRCGPMPDSPTVDRRWARSTGPLPWWLPLRPIVPEGSPRCTPAARAVTGDRPPGHLVLPGPGGAGTRATALPTDRSCACSTDCR
jgi:hypothetical protein